MVTDASGVAAGADFRASAPGAGDPPIGGATALPVPGHGSGWRVHGHGLRSIGLRLIMPVMVATLGLIALGIVQTYTAIAQANQGGKARVVAATAVAAMRLEHLLEQEIAESDALRARGGTAGAALVTAAHAQTDRAIEAYRSAAAAATVAAPDVRLLLASVETELGALGALRQRVAVLSTSQRSGPSYDRLSDALLALADALPQQIVDPGLAAEARAAVAITAAEHLAAEQRDVLRAVYIRNELGPGDLVQLATLSGARAEREAAFGRFATVAQQARYTELMTGPDVTAANQALSAALGVNPTVKGDPDVWFIAQSSVMRRLHMLQNELTRDLNEVAVSEQDTARNTAVLTAISTFGLITLALGATLVLAIRTSRRLRLLRGAALGVASHDLPDAISALTQADDQRRLREAVRNARQRVEEVSLSGADEITEVAAALGQVHRQALRLAADQAAMRLDTAALFVALSRRGQTLIQRQLKLIDDFERSETDPTRLSRLFSLDHLAARMRRNEENLLVLAGGEPGGRVAGTVPLIDLIRAAAAEIEEYERIDASDVAEVSVLPAAVRDLIHLLAELLENATFFSPPGSRVRVTARRTVDAVTIAVFDEGIGMPPARVAEVNERLARPGALTAELAGTMGLLVVARLAARHEISVVLRSALRGGTVALVALPDALLTQTPPMTPHTTRLHGGYASPVVVSASRADGGYLVTSAPAAVPAQPALERPPAAAGRATVNGGLPRRRPGDLLHPPVGNNARPRPASHRAPAVPDPESIRSRLSGLATGLAEAARHTGTIPVVPTTPNDPGRSQPTG